MTITRHLPTPIKQAAKRTLRAAAYLTHPVRHLMRAPLESFRLNWHSQNGEDGVVAELLRRLNITRGWVVEFGAWDGIWCSNTYHLIETNPQFKAVYIEGDANRFNDLLATVKKHEGRIVPINAFVEPKGVASLDALLAPTGIPKDFDILSIDVDSIDYQIWESFSNYRPKIVIIEINSSVPLDVPQTHGVDGGRGTSFSTMLALGHAKGYSCVLHTGNMFFVRNDLVEKVFGHASSGAQERATFRFKQ